MVFVWEEKKNIGISFVCVEEDDDGGRGGGGLFCIFWWRKMYFVKFDDLFMFC